MVATDKSVIITLAVPVFLVLILIEYVYGLRVGKNNYRISDAILYVTLEPCLMCISAICEARIDLVVFGAYTSNEKNFFSKYDFIKKEFRFNHKPKFMGGILENECSILMKDFFKAKRG